MDAVGLVWSRKGLQLVHRCRRCGAERRNRVATATEQADDVGLLARLPLL